MPPLLSAEQHLVVDMKIVMQSMKNLQVQREWQSILGNQYKFCSSGSIKGSKLIVRIHKGRMLAVMITLWDILHKKIEVEFEFITCQVHSQMFHKPGSQPLYEKVQREMKVG